MYKFDLIPVPNLFYYVCPLYFKKLFSDGRALRSLEQILALQEFPIHFYLVIISLNFLS